MDIKQTISAEPAPWRSPWRSPMIPMPDKFPELDAAERALREAKSALLVAKFAVFVNVIVLIFVVTNALNRLPVL